MAYQRVLARVAILALGADGYITKPYTKRILADVINRVLKPEG